MAGVIPGYTGAGRRAIAEWFGATGDGTTDDYSALNDAKSFLSSGGTLELSPGKTYSIETSLELTAGITLKSRGGGKIKPANGIALTLNEQVDCYKEQVFDLSASGTTSLAIPMKVRPEWWGTCSTSNNTVQHAIDSVTDGSTILLSDSYTVSTTTINVSTGASGISMIGEGCMPAPGSSSSLGPQLYLDDGQNDNTLVITGGGSQINADVYLHNFRIYGNKSNQTGGTAGLRLWNVSYIYIGNLLIENCYTDGINGDGGTNDRVFCNLLQCHDCGTGGAGRGARLDDFFDSQLCFVRITDCEQGWYRGGSSTIGVIEVSGTTNSAGLVLSGAGMDYNIIGAAITHDNSAAGCNVQSDGNMIGYILAYDNGSQGLYVGSDGERNHFERVVAYDDQATPTQTYAVYDASTGGKNRVGSYTHDGNMVTSTVYSAAAARDIGNSYDQGFFQRIEYAAAITPDPFDGRVISISALTGNLTINNVGAAKEVAGARMTFLFEQDGTGGRTVGWGGDYNTTWADAGNAASTKSSITFVHDGTEWKERSYTPWY